MHAFPKRINPKMNKIVRLEFEHVVRHVNHYATKTLLRIVEEEEEEEEE